MFFRLSLFFGVLSCVLAVTTWVIELMVREVMCGVAEDHGGKRWMLFTVAIKLPLENRFDFLVWGRMAALCAG